MIMGVGLGVGVAARPSMRASDVRVVRGVRVRVRPRTGSDTTMQHGVRWTCQLAVGFSISNSGFFISYLPDALHRHLMRNISTRLSVRVHSHGTGEASRESTELRRKCRPL